MWFYSSILESFRIVKINIQNESSHGSFIHATIFLSTIRNKSNSTTTLNREFASFACRHARFLSVLARVAT